ncbi:MAG: ABC transporter ATP-binding protein [Beutenbergiaceae bacterium]
MIELNHVSLTYPDAAQATLTDIDFRVSAGQMMLVVGATGAGKSTLLAAMCGRFPHSTGGTLAGTVRIAGRDTAQQRPRDLADVLGVVGQDPQASFVTSTVEQELAYTLEQLGLSVPQMRERVQEVLDRLELAELRHRRLHSLSAGQQQRVAIGAVLTARPSVLLLDEPTSALDPASAAQVLALVHQLATQGLTVVLAEHRIERVMEVVDRVALVADGTVRVGEPRVLLPSYHGAPPVAALGRALGWDPVPVTLAQAAPLARAWRAQASSSGDRYPVPCAPGAASSRTEPCGQPAANPPLMRVDAITVRHGATVAVDNVDLTLRSGEVTALMGPNGAGKSSLLWALQERADLPVALLPQPASDLLYLPSVQAECQASDAFAGAGRTRTELDSLVVGLPEEAHPRDLSEGQRLALALAIQLSREPTLVLLDEPTRGLDAGAKAALATRLRELAVIGRAVLVATHDTEFAASCAHRVIKMADGRVVADGVSADILTDPISDAPQMAQLLGNQTLTVAQALRWWGRPDAHD